MLAYDIQIRVSLALGNIKKIGVKGLFHSILVLACDSNNHFCRFKKELSNENKFWGTVLAYE